MWWFLEFGFYYNVIAGIGENEKGTNLPLHSIFRKGNNLTEEAQNIKHLNQATLMPPAPDSLQRTHYKTLICHVQKLCGKNSLWYDSGLF